MADLRSSIDSKRKVLFSEDHIQKPFTGDDLVYLEGAQRLITTLHEEIQSASNKLTTAHCINLLKKFPFCIKKIVNVKKTKGKQEESEKNQGEAT